MSLLIATLFAYGDGSKNSDCASRYTDSVPSYVGANFGLPHTPTCRARQGLSAQHIVGQFRVQNSPTDFATESIHGLFDVDGLAVV